MDIKTNVEFCAFCWENKRTQRKEPLKPSVNKGQVYLIVSDYYSPFTEILHLLTTDGERKRCFIQTQQAFYFNRRHGVRKLPLLKLGAAVLMKLEREKV